MDRRKYIDFNKKGVRFKAYDFHPSWHEKKEFKDKAWYSRCGNWSLECYNEQVISNLENCLWGWVFLRGHYFDAFYKSKHTTRGRAPRKFIKKQLYVNI